MPYITNERRLELDCRVDEWPENAGELNYLVSTACDQFIYANGLNYTNINTLIGVLECAKMELYRRVAAPYEDEKIKENGDVYTC